MPRTRFELRTVRVGMFVFRDLRQMFRWFDRDDLHRMEALQLQTLRKVNWIMAEFADLHKDVDAMKEKLSHLDNIWDAYDKVRMQLAECLAKDEMDKAEVQKVHDEMAALIAD